MRSRSSIFNFKFAAALTVTTLILGVAYLWVCNLPHVKRWNTRVGSVIDCLEANLIEADRADFDIVLFMGSSRLHSCVDTKMLDDLDPTGTMAFVNLAQSGMGPWEADVVLRNTRHDLDRIKAVVLEVNPWTFNDHRRHPVTGKPLKYPFEFDVWASIAERWSIDSLRSKVRLSATFVPRRSLRDWCAILSHDFSTEIPRALPRPEYHHDEDALAEIRHKREFEFANIAPMHLHQYEFSHGKLDRFNSLLTRLEAS